MSTTHRHKVRSAVVVLITAAFVGVGLAAYAYWTSEGDGDGGGTTGTSGQFVVTGGTSTDAALTPGGAAQSIPFEVENSTDASLRVTAVDVSIVNADGSAWTQGTCGADDFALGVPTMADMEIAAGATASGTVTLSLVHSPTQNQDDCKSVSVPVQFAAS
jgi:hypothetical protein